VDSQSGQVIVGFPLRGEWTAPTTPGKKVPSHGTDMLGERYAFDFVKVDWTRRGKPFYNANWFTYILFGVPLNKCYGWGKDIHAPCDGTIIKAEDGCRERRRVHPLSDLVAYLKNTISFNPGKDSIQRLAGNYIIMNCGDGVFAAFAHLQNGSITVSAGQTVTRGQFLGKVGHSGNSTAPHLHFQLMDDPDILVARGVPCAFDRCEVFRDGAWAPVEDHVPADKERIRAV
jgi:murein DD-endopeptidase MepM/ murein hydrolase activator NlpD